MSDLNSKVNNAHDLETIFSQRAAYYGPEHQATDKLVAAYNGVIPEEFRDFFHDEMHVHLINTIRLAWDDLSNLAGKEFPLYVRPRDNKSTSQERAEKLEMVGYSWNRAGRVVGGISMKTLMKVLSWWLVGTANAVAMALPDFKHKTPFFTFRDPRTHFPPAGWTPYTQAAPDDTLFAYRMTVGEIKRRYPDAADEISRSIQTIYASSGPPMKGSDDEQELWVGEYYHKDTWMVGTIQDKSVTLARSDTGDRGHPGVMPVVSCSLYTGGGAKGRSIFSDQLSIQAAMARMFSQKLDFFDRTLYPLIFHTPLAGKTIRIGPYATNEYDTSSGVTPRVDAIGPAQNMDADQTMQFAVALSRMLNRNPEAFQGAGDADSAKALAELKSGVTQTIRDGFWPTFIENLPKLYEAAARMDVELWGDTRKTALGDKENSPFVLPYTPNSLLRGRETDYEIEPGVGLAGYQGTLELMQLYGAKMVSLDTVLEQGEWTHTPQEERRKIQKGQLEELTLADLAAKAQEGILVPGALPEIRRKVAEGKDLYDAIEEMDKAGRLWIQPPEQGVPGLGGLPGGGPPMPGAEEPPLPSLEALRG